MRLRLKWPSPAMAVACIALAVALSGASYAAVVLPRNSVGTKQLRNNAVKSNKIAPNQVTGEDVNEATLGQVPSAVNAQSAANAQSAQNAVNAQNAANAENAENADNAANAQTAQNAAHANNADNATQAASANDAAALGGVAAVNYQQRCRPGAISGYIVVDGDNSGSWPTGYTDGLPWVKRSYSAFNPNTCLANPAASPRVKKVGTGRFRVHFPFALEAIGNVIGDPDDFLGWTLVPEPELGNTTVFEVTIVSDGGNFQSREFVLAFL